MDSEFISWLELIAAFLYAVFVEMMAWVLDPAHAALGYMEVN